VERQIYGITPQSQPNKRSYHYMIVEIIWEPLSVKPCGHGHAWPLVMRDRTRSTTAAGSGNPFTCWI